MKEQAIKRVQEPTSKYVRFRSSDDELGVRHFRGSDESTWRSERPKIPPSDR